MPRQAWSAPRRVTWICPRHRRERACSAIPRSAVRALAALSIGRQWTEARRPGWPIESAPAVSPPMADSRPMTSPAAMPRSWPSVRSCSFSGSRLAAHGRKTSATIAPFSRHRGRDRERAFQADPIGMIGEAGARFADIDAADGAAVRSTPAGGSFRTSSSSSGRSGKSGSPGSSRCRAGDAARRPYSGKSQAERLGHQKAAPELARRLAGFEFDQKPAADAGRQRELILAHPETFAPFANGSAEDCGHGRGLRIDRTVAHEKTHVPAQEQYAQNVNFGLRKSPAGNMRCFRRCFASSGKRGRSCSRTGTIRCKRAISA